MPSTTRPLRLRRVHPAAAFLLAVTAAAWWPALVQATTPEPTLSAALQDKQLQGNARLRVWGFEVYDAKLWAGANFDAQRYEQQRDELEEIFRDFRASPPMEPKLADIKCPALLLWGRKDRLIDVSSVAIWSKGLADLRVEIWEGIGHMPMLEAPAGSARLYREFLASLRSESPQDQRLH